MLDLQNPYPPPLSLCLSFYKQWCYIHISWKGWILSSNRICQIVVEIVGGSICIVDSKLNYLGHISGLPHVIARIPLSSMDHMNKWVNIILLITNLAKLTYGWLPSQLHHKIEKKQKFKKNLNLCMNWIFLHQLRIEISTSWDFMDCVLAKGCKRVLH
jgi:hypothetical protein